MDTGTIRAIYGFKDPTFDPVPDLVPDTILPGGLNIGPVANLGPATNLRLNDWSLGINLPAEESRHLPDPPTE